MRVQYAAYIWTCAGDAGVRRRNTQADELLDDKAGSSPLKAKAPAGRAKAASKGRRKTLGGDDKQSNHDTLMKMDRENLELSLGQVESKHENLLAEHNAMELDGKKQQQDFIRREVQYKSQLTRMKELLDKAEQSRGGEDVGMPK